MITRPLQIALFAASLILHAPLLYGQRIAPDNNVSSAAAKEQVVLRTPFAKHFVAPDGKARAIISAKPIHYRDGKGRFQDIDCSLQAASRDGYIAENTRNTISSFFPADARKGVRVASVNGEVIIGINPVLKIVTSEGRMLWSKRATRSRASSSGNRMTYANLFPNASNNYEVDPNQLKNNLVLTARPAALPRSDAYLIYSEVLQLPRGWKLSARVNELNREALLKGGLSIINTQGQEAFNIPVPDVFELNNPSNGVHVDGNWENTYKVKFLGGDKYELSTMVPAEWLSDPARQYPVVIDPTITANGNYGGWQNTAPAYLNGNPTSFVFVGLNTNGFTYNGYIRFSISSVPAGATVTDTRLQLGLNSSGNATTETVQINAVSGAVGPYVSFSQAVFDDLGDGTYTTFACDAPNTYGFFDLGTTADNDVMNRLGTGTFQVGLSITSPTTWKRFTSNAAVLEVTYIIPPSGLDLAAGSDTGTDNADNITSDQTPTISGAAPAGVTIRLYSGVTEIGSVLSDAVTGAWEITSSVLAEGQHALTATSEDGTSVSNPSAQLNVTIDASIAAPAGLDLSATSDSGVDTDNITNDNTPTISGTAEAASTVKVYNGATEIGSATADGTTGAWQITATSLTDGAKSITAKATDIAGNESSASSILTITVDTSTPAPTGLDLSAISDSGINTDNVTNDNTPTITGTAEASATVKLYDGVTEIGSATADGTTGAWQITAISLTDGTKSITAKATDVAANEGVASSVLSVTIDTSPPANPGSLDLIASSDSGLDTDNITNDNTPAIAGSADPGVTIKLYDGITEIGSATADGTTGTWQITGASLTDGVKSITAKASDLAGNESGASSVLSVTIDTSAPPSPSAPDLVAGSDSGVDTDNITNDNTPSISGSAQAGALVRVFDGPTEIGSATADVTTGAWQIISGSLTDGAKNFTAKASDVAGNESTASPVLAITIDTSAPPAPTALDLAATSDSGVDTDNVTSDNSPAISGSSEAGIALKLYDGTIEIGSTTSHATTGAWQITTATLTDGTKSITAKATDIAGNESAASSVLTLTIDTNAPSAPAGPDLVASSDSGNNTDNITNDNTPAISGTAEAGAAVKIYNGVAEIGSATAQGIAGGWEVTAASLADGTATITAKAIDVAGNESVSSSILTITIDTSAPSAPSALDLVASSDSGINTDNITNDNTPSISGSAEAGVVIKLFDGATEIGMTTADPTTGAWQITTSALSNGGKSLTARAADIAGNESSLSLPLNITLDDIRPVATISSNAPQRTREAFTVVIGFNENITGFDIGDITVTNGTASQFIDAGNSQYNVRITPTTEGAVAVTIPGDAATDIAGNSSTTASLTRDFDNAAPKDYTIRFMPESIDINNVNNVSLIIEGAEVGATYHYEVSSENGGQPLTGTAVVATTQFSIDGLNMEGLENGLLTATVYLRDDLGNQGVDRTAQAMKNVQSEVVIYTTFTPNGDGINDVWKMPSLTYYNDVEIEVFDRGGVRVFYTNNPDNGWDGKNQNGLILTGAYMYIVRVRDTNLVKKGTLTVLK